LGALADGREKQRAEQGTRGLLRLCLPSVCAACSSSHGGRARVNQPRMAFIFRSIQRGLAVVGGVTLVGVGGTAYVLQRARQVPAFPTVTRALARRRPPLSCDARLACPPQDALQHQLNLPEQFVLDIDLEDILLVERSIPNPLLQAERPHARPWRARTAVWQRS